MPLARRIAAILRSVSPGGLRSAKSAAERAEPGFRGVVEATRADIDTLVGFEAPIQRAHEKFFPDEFPRETTPDDIALKFARLIAEPNAGVAVYVADRKTVGYISWVIHAQQAHDVAIINAIVVANGYRRAGVGRALLSHARVIARESGAARMTAHVWAENEPSRRFFEAESFAARYTVYGGQIDGDG